MTTLPPLLGVSGNAKDRAGVEMPGHPAGRASGGTGHGTVHGRTSAARNGPAGVIKRGN